jgi:hypothetical protein
MKFSAIMITSIIVIALIPISSYIQSQNEWATYNVVSGKQGNYFVSNSNYNVSVNVNVPSYVSGGYLIISINPLATSNPSSPSKGQFWFIRQSPSQSYSLTNEGKTVIFRSPQPGVYNLTALFSLPINLTETVSNGITIYMNFSGNIITAQYIKPNNQSLDVGDLTALVVDQKLLTYQSTLSSLSNSWLKEDSTFRQNYGAVYSNLVSQANSLASKGLYDQALDTLSALSNIISSLPAPPSYTLQYSLIIALGVIIIAMGGLVIFLLRRTAQASQMREVLSKVSQELSGLEVIVSKYDKSVAEKLNQIKRRISEVI